MLGTCLQNVREKGPLVHNITNYVTVNDVANVILACGASPIMSDEPQDGTDTMADVAEGGDKAGAGSDLTAALAEWQDKFIRLQAEFDNYRKRTLKEKMDLVQTGGRDVLLAMLPVRDDVQRAVDAMLQQIDEIGLQAQHDRLGFRIAKAAVEFDHLRVALLVDHQTCIKETGVGITFRRHAFYSRPDDAIHRALMHFISDHRSRRVCAHTTGIRAGVCIANALMILAGGHRQNVFAIDHHEEAA